MREQLISIPWLFWTPLFIVTIVVSARVRFCDQFMKSTSSEDISILNFWNAASTIARQRTSKCTHVALCESASLLTARIAD
jgi:hypothetical protein